MKKQTKPRVQAHLIRSAFYVILLLAICVIPIALAQRNATKQSMVKLGNASRANIIVVTNTNDSGPGSLRDALAVANDGDAIDATGISGTILLTSGELQIAHSVTINGPGAGTLAANGNGTFRVFEIFASDVTISGFTITNGLGGINNENGTTTTVSNCTISGNFGGGISNVSGGLCCATLTVTNSTISDNSADSGGGISNSAFDGGAFLTVSNSTISDNSATSDGGAILNTSGGGALAVASVTISNSILSGNTVAGGGGAIFNSTLGQQATLMITNSTISGNSAGGGSGGISNLNGTVTVINSTISANSTGGGGGGISNKGGRGSATLMVTNCTVGGNTAALNGGGISNGADEGGAALTISNSTISGNSANFGGGISNTGGAQLAGEVVNVINSTISGNSADNGGGIGNAAGVGDASEVNVSNSTLSGNWATGNGGGVCNENAGGSTTLELSDIILNTGNSGENIFNDGGTVTSLGYNLSSDDGAGLLTGPGDQINTDPMLGPLQNNGGPTFTHALLPGSPAIDAGNPNFTPPPFYDQRGPGYPRVFNGRIDIGSFEVQRPAPTPRPRPTPHLRPTPPQ